MIGNHIAMHGLKCFLKTQIQEMKDINIKRKIFIILRTEKILGHCWTVMGNMLRTLWQLLEKQRMCPVFSRTLHIPCAGNVRLSSVPGIIISNTFFDDNQCLFFCSYFLVFFCTKNNKHVFAFYLCPFFLMF